MSNCSHKRKLPDQWVSDIGWDGEEYGWWEDGDEVSTTVDIDLHRYKCTQCGEVMYYSSRARDHFENGTTYDIKGLNK